MEVRTIKGHAYGAAPETRPGVYRDVELKERKDLVALRIDREMNVRIRDAMRRTGKNRTQVMIEALNYGLEKVCR